MRAVLASLLRSLADRIDPDGPPQARWEPPARPAEYTSPVDPQALWRDVSADYAAYIDDGYDDEWRGGSPYL